MNRRKEREVGTNEERKMRIRFTWKNEKLSVDKEESRKREKNWTKGIRHDEWEMKERKRRKENLKKNGGQTKISECTWWKQN